MRERERERELEMKDLRLALTVDFYNRTNKIDTLSITYQLKFRGGKTTRQLLAVYFRLL